MNVCATPKPNYVKAKDGIRWNLLAGNSMIVLSSEKGFRSKAVAKKNYKAAMKIILMHRPTLYQDKRGEWRWRIRKVGSSEGFSRKYAAERNLWVCRRAAWVDG